MNTVIEQILDIDRLARERIEQVEIRCSEIINEAKDAQSKEKNKILVMSEKNLKKVEESEKIELNKKIEVINREANEIKSNLSKQFDELHKVWEDSFFADIVSS